ncbi:hypothetical protein DFJ77DRAFT_448129 [Powellomyces hirtus]|nr:hypothetical protein DFJ77DRAFT_448129 [Powellomyces hirtus]
MSFVVVLFTRVRQRHKKFATPRGCEGGNPARPFAYESGKKWGGSSSAYIHVKKTSLSIYSSVAFVGWGRLMILFFCFCFRGVVVLGVVVYSAATTSATVLVSSSAPALTKSIFRRLISRTKSLSAGPTVARGVLLLLPARAVTSWVACASDTVMPVAKRRAAMRVDGRAAGAPWAVRPSKDWRKGPRENCGERSLEAVVKRGRESGVERVMRVVKSPAAGGGGVAGGVAGGVGASAGLSAGCWGAAVGAGTVAVSVALVSAAGVVVVAGAGGAAVGVSSFCCCGAGVAVFFAAPPLLVFIAFCCPLPLAFPFPFLGGGGGVAVVAVAAGGGGVAVAV